MRVVLRNCRLRNTSTRDFLLKPELLRAISDLGFEHPSEGRYNIFDQGGSRSEYVL
jgi:hypothetical protein